jgi:hypothetical protein
LIASNARCGPIPLPPGDREGRGASRWVGFCFGGLSWVFKILKTDGWGGLFSGVGLGSAGPGLRSQVSSGEEGLSR